MKDCMQMIARISRETLTFQDGKEAGRHEPADGRRPAEAEISTADQRPRVARHYHRR